MPDNVIQVHDLNKVYGRSEDIAVHALRDVSLNIGRGEFVAVMGPSGSGKSTLMNILGALDRPTSGSYILDGQDISRLTISVKEGASIDAVKNQLTLLLRERRNMAENEDDDFRVMDTRQIAETLTSTTKILTMLLAAVAAVSLLVGGIGIMNIMLVSVTERTREIGIRLAIGALEREVLLQFLIEAVVLSSLGGLIGIAIATAASIFLAGLMGVPYLFDPSINLLSFFFSAAIGVIFGYFPARRAASLNPIDALRHE
jgi:putative ABC transport system permease protein